MVGSPKDPQDPTDPQVVPGSTRLPMRGVLKSAPLPPDAPIDVTVRLRAAAADKAAQVYKRRPAKRVNRATLAGLVGASAADAQAVEKLAHEQGLTVVEVSLPRRTIVLRGTAAQMQKAFGVSLQAVETATGTYRQRTGEVHIPPALAGIVTGVFGLDDRPQAKPHFRRRAAAAAAGGLSPLAVGKAYSFPATQTGKGQVIGLIELGGGYKASDLATYFQKLGVSAPTVVAVGVDGGTNAPTGSLAGADAEVGLDIEVAGALAPAAAIVVYFAPNTDRGFLDAVTTAVHDTTHAPTVISISWGGAESTWTSQATTALDEAMAEAVAVGIPVCVACGDDGATDGQTDGQLHVDFPASSPNAIACGGTRLTVSGTTASDVTWNDLPSEGATGGGFSAVFPAPAWQSAAVKPFNKTGRGVPDVSGDADPETGYAVYIDGTSTVLGGTSAVAPLWAALIARCQQASGEMPTDLSARLYGAGGSGFRDVTKGGNGGYNARPGWDPCTGLGVPIGSKLLTAVWGNSSAPAKPPVKKKAPVKKKPTGPAKKGKRK